jgi:hypothetical protein
MYTNMPLYKAELVLHRFVAIKFSLLDEYADDSNATVTSAHCKTL